MNGSKESPSRMRGRLPPGTPRRRPPWPMEGWAAIAAVGFILLIVLATLPRLPW
ncbi:MAG: hypothetical protein WBW74_12255 [Xanthobacteraceae bacterium]